jgi:hypothetical protein
MNLRITLASPVVLLPVQVYQLIRWADPVVSVNLGAGVAGVPV